MATMATPHQRDPIPALPQHVPKENSSSTGHSGLNRRTNLAILGPSTFGGMAPWKTTHFGDGHHGTSSKMENGLPWTSSSQRVSHHCHHLRMTHRTNRPQKWRPESLKALNPWRIPLPPSKAFQSPTLRLQSQQMQLLSPESITTLRLGAETCRREVSGTNFCWCLKHARY